MSQSTTDGNEEVDESTQSYVECTQPECLSDQDRDDLLRNWPHDRQPGWSQYSESMQSSLVSRVPRSLDESRAQQYPVTRNEPEPFDPVANPNQVARIYVPETPESTQAGRVPRRVRPIMSKREAEEQINRITEYLEVNNYTVFTHKTTYGNYEKTMHLAFFVYDNSNVVDDNHETNDSI